MLDQSRAGIMTLQYSRSATQVKRKAQSYMCTAKVAKLLRVHPNTLRKWSDLGIINSTRSGPMGKRKYQREDIIDFLISRVIQKECH